MSNDLKSVAKCLGLMLSLACLGYFAFVMFSHIEVRVFLIALGELGIFVPLSLLLYLAAFAPILVVWKILLHAAGAKTAPWTSTAIFLVSQFAKYLPGNVAHLVGRAFLAKRTGIPVATTAVATAFEMTLTILSALLIILIFLLAGLSSLSAVGTLMVSAALLVAISGTIVASAITFHKDLVWPRPLALLLCTALLVVMFLFTAAAQGLLIVAASNAAIDPSQTMVIASAIVVSWLAGFLTPGSPAGIGVREAGLVLTLQGIVDAESIIIAAAIMRLVTLAGDLFMWLAGLALWSSLFGSSDRTAKAR